MSKMLTAEFNLTLNRVEIRADANGIRFLRKKLKKARKTKKEIRIEANLSTKQIGVDTLVTKEVLLCFRKPDATANLAASDRTGSE